MHVERDGVMLLVLRGGAGPWGAFLHGSGLGSVICDACVRSVYAACDVVGVTVWVMMVVL